MTTSKIRAPLNPLTLLYEDLSESRKLSRALREARQVAATNGAEARTNSLNETVDSLRALVVQTSSVVTFTGRTQLDRSSQPGAPDAGAPSAESVSAGYARLAGYGRPPNESDLVSSAYEGAVAAFDQALARLGDERQDLVRRAEQLRDEDSQRTA